MRKMFFWVVTLLLLATVSLWAYSTFAPVRNYAPGTEEAALTGVEPPPVAQQAAYPAPSPEMTPPVQSAATAPDQPVPYDQLQSSADAPAAPPVDAKSDDKAIFY